MVGEQNMGESGWWLASDGRYYPPNLHPSRRPEHDVDLRDALVAAWAGQYASDASTAALETSGDTAVEAVATADHPVAHGSIDDQRRSEHEVIDLSAPARPLDSPTNDGGTNNTASGNQAGTTLQRRCRSCWQMTDGYVATCGSCGADPVAAPTRVHSATKPVSIFTAPDPVPAEPVAALAVPERAATPRRSVIAEAFGLPRAGSILIAAGCLVAVAGTMCTALLGERLDGELQLITITSGLVVTMSLALTLMGLGHSLRVAGADTL